MPYQPDPWCACFCLSLVHLQVFQCYTLWRTDKIINSTFCDMDLSPWTRFAIGNVNQFPKVWGPCWMAQFSSIDCLVFRLCTIWLSCFSWLSHWLLFPLTVAPRWIASQTSWTSRRILARHAFTLHGCSSVFFFSHTTLPDGNVSQVSVTFMDLSLMLQVLGWLEISYIEQIFWKLSDKIQTFIGPLGKRSRYWLGTWLFRMPLLDMIWTRK